VDKKDAHKTAKRILDEMFRCSGYGFISKRCGVPLETVMEWEDPNSEELPNLAELLLAFADQTVACRFIQVLLDSAGLDDANPSAVADIGLKAIETIRNMPLHRFDPSDYRCVNAAHSALVLASHANLLALDVTRMARAPIVKAMQR